MSETCQWIGTDYHPNWNEYAWLVQCKGDDYRDMHNPLNFTYCPHCGREMAEPLVSTAAKGRGK